MWGGGVGEGRRGGGAGAGRERGRGARLAALRPAAASVRGAETPLALSSAQLSHNGQLFLTEGAGRVGGRAPAPTPASSSSRAPVDTRCPDPKLGRTEGIPGAPFFCSPGAGWRQVPRISDARKWEGRGGGGKNDFFKICAVNHPQNPLQGVWCPNPMTAPSLRPLTPGGGRGTGAVGRGSTEREKCPHSKNMSTNSKWTPGCSPPFKGSFSPSATAGAALPLASASRPRPLLPEAGDGRVTEAAETLGV